MEFWTRVFSVKEKMWYELVLVLVLVMIMIIV